MNFLIISSIVTIKDVLLNGGVEEKRLLHNDTDLVSELFDVIVTNVNSVNEELASSNIIESEKKVCNGTFTAT